MNLVAGQQEFVNTGGHSRMYKPHFLKALVAALVISFHCTSAVSALSCGPGNGWVSTCPAGTETLQITMNFGIDTDFDSFANIDVSFTGELVIQAGAPYASDPIHAPGNLDRIDTEILSMNLTGSSAFVNGWVFRMGVNEGIAPSFGFIQEQSNATTALSRYDTVFEIDSIPYGTLTHNANPTVFFQDLIGGLPEVGAKYNHTGGPFGTTILLFDARGTEVLRLTDLIVTDFATIGRPHFIVNSVVVPVPAAGWLFGVGLMGMIGIASRKNTAQP